ncbi:hypothetical protein BDV32DRAFT_145232 [Aspergillus pseudonomiae]|nr:hypothetical protein BDV32DRAFT_145232 [Aspergillus pseudonomiae]
MKIDWLPFSHLFGPEMLLATILVLRAERNYRERRATYNEPKGMAAMNTPHRYPRSKQLNHREGDAWVIGTTTLRRRSRFSKVPGNLQSISSGIAGGTSDAIEKDVKYFHYQAGKTV